MSSARFIILIIFISLASAAGLLFLGSGSEYNFYKGGYAVLAVDSSIDEDYLVPFLNEGLKGIGDGIISESSQWVLLDAFSYLEMIPLASYSQRVLPFDPRNDGYAQKLAGVFFRDGKRLIYIPLEKGYSLEANMEKQLESLLGDIPYSVAVYGRGEPVNLYFLAFALAFFIFLLICYAKKSLRANARIMAVMPPLCALCFFGSSALACAAIITGIFSALNDPLREIADLKNTKGSWIMIKGILRRYRPLLVFLPLLAGSLALIIIFSNINLAFFFAVFFSSLVIFSLCALEAAGIFRFFPSAPGRRHLFRPVAIIGKNAPFSFSLYMLPFAAAAFLTVIFIPIAGDSRLSDKSFEITLEEKDYFDHLVFQATFSTRQLGGTSLPFYDYYFDEDGLPYASQAAEPDFDIIKGQFPPFPLKDLKSFFDDFNENHRSSGNSGIFSESTGRNTEKMPLLILILFVPLAFFSGRREKNQGAINLCGLKAKSSKHRLTGYRKNVFEAGAKKMRFKKDA